MIVKLTVETLCNWFAHPIDLIFKVRYPILQLKSALFVEKNESRLVKINNLTN